MAKISFLKLGLKTNSDVRNITYNDQDIEIKQYLPVEKKIEVINEIINSTVEDIGFFNPFKLEIITNFCLIKAYTNINFTEKQITEDFFKTYNLLESSGLMTEIFAAIPEDEIDCIRKASEKSSKAIMEYNNSVSGLLERVSQDYSNVTFDLDKLQEVLGNPENLTLVKEMIKNV